MAIEFSCSSCQKNYRVKEELAGKTAECSACAKPMRIPVLVAAASESDLNLNGLIDDELPVEASATLTPAVTTKCRECGAPVLLDAVVCVACGFDKRLGDVLETESEQQMDAVEARGTSDFLKRGGAFSFGGAMIGAALWLGLAIVAGVGVKVGYPAILIGVLAGLGMKRGYGGSPNFIAGMIASVMALAGIFAAKGLIFDHLRAGDSSANSMMGMFNIFDVFFVLAAMAAAYALARGDHALDTNAA